MTKLHGSILFLAGLLALCGCESAVDGAAGLDGAAGTAGADGTDGADGTEGTDGADGTDGTAGADGADGTNGANGADVPTTSFAGSVDNAGTPGEGFVVALSAVAPDASHGAVLGVNVADTAGDFTITQPGGMTPGTSFRYEAYGAGRALTALVTDLQQDVTPATTAVDEIVSLLVESDGGVAMSDYTIAEVLASVSAADVALLAEATDLLDDEAVFTEVLASVGESIADQSGVDPALEASVAPAPAAPTGALVESTSSTTTLENELEWAIQNDGETSSGPVSNSAFQLERRDNCCQAFVRQFAGPTRQLQDDRTVVLGPMTDFDDIAGLSVTRKIYVPTTGNWARWTEIFENAVASCSDTSYLDETSCTGASETWTANTAVSLTMMLECDLDGGDEITGPTSDGDNVMNTGDVWVTIDDDVDNLDGREAIGWYFPGADTVRLSGDDIEYEYEITVPAGGRVTLVHWAMREATQDDLEDCDDGSDNDGNSDADSADPDCLVDPSQPYDPGTCSETLFITEATCSAVSETWTYNPVDPTANEAGAVAGTTADLATQLALLDTTASIEYFEGMTAGEITDSTYTFTDNPLNLVGAAGSVAPWASVTATNQNSGVAASAVAASDGSFTMTVLAATGELVDLTTDLGRADTLTTP